MYTGTRTVKWRASPHSLESVESLSSYDLQEYLYQTNLTAYLITGKLATHVRVFLIDSKKENLEEKIETQLRNQDITIGGKITWDLGHFNLNNFLSSNAADNLRVPSHVSAPSFP